MSKRKKTTITTLSIAVLATYVMPNISFVVNPALQGLATEVYPNLSFSTVSLLSTVMSLMMIPSSLIVGAVVGRKVGYRPMAVLSGLCIIIGGVLPFFITSFPFVLMCRAVVGIGIGITFPLQGSLIPALFSEDKRPGLFGAGATTMSICGILYQILSGFMADIGALYPWLVHLLIIIPLLCVIFFLKEPEPQVENEKTDTDSKKDSGKLPKRVVFIFIAHALLFMASYPILLNMTSILAYRNLGTASLSGIISSMWTVGGVLAGIIFGKLNEISGKYIVPIGCAEWILGVAVLAFGHTVPLLFAGTLICGIAVQTCWPATINNYSLYVPKDKLGIASALYTSGMCLGCFLCTYFNIFAFSVSGSSDPQIVMKYGLIIAAIVGVIWSIIEIRKPTEALAKEINY